MDLSYVHLINSGQYSQLNSGTALSNSTTTTDISPGGNTSGQAFSFSSSSLQLGVHLRVRAKGIVSNTGTPTLNLGVYYGGAAGTALATTGAVTTLTGLSNALWHLECDLRVDAVGAGTAGSIKSLGSVTGISASPVMMPASSASGNAVAVNTTSGALLTIAATWGTASASNSIQVIMFTVERLEEGAS